MPFFLSLQQNIELSKVSKNYTTLFFLSKTLETCLKNKNFLTQMIKYQFNNINCEKENM